MSLVFTNLFLKLKSNHHGSGTRRYLNDHLAGSSGGLLLIQELADGHDDPQALEFFLQFKVKVEADRSLLEKLLVKIGQNPSAFLKTAGAIRARIGGIRKPM